MSTESLVLFVIAALFGFWQIVLVCLAIAYANSGRAVRIPLVPLIVAATFTVIGILLR